MGVGKTTLLNGYAGGGQAKGATMGPDFRKKDLRVGNVEVNMQIWDTAGQEQYASLSFSYFRGADCCMLVFDVTNKASFDNLQKWSQQLITNLNVADPKSYPMIIIGNKCDCENRAVSEDEARAWCQANGGYQYLETSALNGTNVTQAFEELAKKQAKAQESNSQLGMPTGLMSAEGAMQLSAQDDSRRTQTLQDNKKKKKGCC